MSELEELRRRLDALEGEMARLREDAATSRSLAAMADRDVAEMRTTLRGHMQVLNALRETQLEQERTLQGLAEVVGGLVTGQTALVERQDAMAERQDAMAQQQTAMARQLQRIEHHLTGGASASDG